MRVYGLCAAFVMVIACVHESEPAPVTGTDATSTSNVSVGDSGSSTETTAVGSGGTVEPTTSPGTTSTSDEVICGDSDIDTGEECDDGPDVEDVDPCTPLCTYGVCGDGYLQPSLGEFCDHGLLNNDEALCKSDCTFAMCGDGILQADNEESCDAGESNGEYGSKCTHSCMIADEDFCGDGVLQGEYEECEPSLAPSAPCVGCKLGGRFVFVTSTTTQGDFGGLSGADAICQAAAAIAGLPGSYRAWVSTGPCPTGNGVQPPVSAKDRLFPGDDDIVDPYVVPPGEEGVHVIASGWEEWNSIMHKQLLDVNEYGVVIPEAQTARVWTGTDNFGDGITEVFGDGDCGCWSQAFGVVGGAGAADSKSEWSLRDKKSCDEWYRLYCVQNHDP